MISSRLVSCSSKKGAKLIEVNHHRESNPVHLSPKNLETTHQSRIDVFGFEARTERKETYKKFMPSLPQTDGQNPSPNI